MSLDWADDPSDNISEPTYYLLYETDTGKILSRNSDMRAMAEIEKDLPEGVQVLEGSDDPSMFYISSGAVTPRTASNITVSSLNVTLGSTVTFSNVPAGATLWVDGIPYVVNDGVMELVLNTVGAYNVRLDEIQYLQESWTVVCT